MSTTPVPQTTARPLDAALTEATGAREACRADTAAARTAVADAVQRLTDARAAAVAAQTAYEDGAGSLDAAAQADATVSVLQRAQARPAAALARAEQAEREADAAHTTAAAAVHAVAQSRALAEHVAEMDAAREAVHAAVQTEAARYLTARALAQTAQRDVVAHLTSGHTGAFDASDFAVAVAQLEQDGGSGAYLTADLVAVPGTLSNSYTVPASRFIKPVPALAPAATAVGASLDQLLR